MTSSSVLRGGLRETLLTKSLASLTAVTLNSDEAKHRTIVLTGNPGGNSTVTLPISHADDLGCVWEFRNSTTGGHAITIAGPTGTGVVVFPGGTARVRSDGTNMVFATPHVTVTTLSIDPASLNATTAADTTTALAGLLVTDLVVAIPPAAGLTAGMFHVGTTVSSAGNLRIRLYNSTGGAINEAAATWTVLVIRA